MVLAKKRLDYLESKGVITSDGRYKIKNNPELFAEELRVIKVNGEPITEDIENELKKIEEKRTLTKEEQEKMVEKLESLGYIG